VSRDADADPVTPARAGRRVAAIHGRDLLSGHPSLLPEALLADGYELLALDRPAIAGLLERKVPFQTPEDWLAAAEGETVKIRSTAERALVGWTAHAPRTLSSDGLCWPDHDHWSVPELWLEMTVALRLAVAFDRAGVARLRFSSEHRRVDFAVREEPPGPIVDLWSRMLPSIVEPISMANFPESRNVEAFRQMLSDSPLGEPLRAARSAVNARRFFIAARELLAEVDRSRLVLLLLPARELDRSGPIVQRLHRHLGTSLVAVPWMDSHELTVEAAGLNEIPWLPTPPLERGPLQEEQRIAAGVMRNISEHDLGELAPAREELSAALQRLASGWAAQARRLRWTVHMLRELRPRLVITARDALPYQVPTEAARIAGVPVITLPHGVIEWSPPERLEPRLGVIHVAGIKNPTAPADALRICHDVLIQHEYPRRVREFLDEASGDTTRVLVLTEGFGALEVRSHQRALKSILAAARILGPAARIALKPHPADPHDEAALMQQDEPPGPCVVSLPRETDVIAAIGASDLVIGVNYVGSALFHAVSAGTPVVRMTIPRMPESDGHTLTNRDAWAVFWDRMLLSVEETDGLVEVLRRMKDPEFVEALRQRSHDAAAALRPDPDAPSIIDVVDEVLTGRTAQNS
jgi:hypothetical protein